MISPVKSYYNAKFKFMNFEALANVFPFIMQTMFQNMPTIHKQSNSRVLELMVANHGDLEESDMSQRSNPTVGLSLKSSQSPFSRNIRITVGENCRLIDVAFEFFEALMDEVDVFKFTMKKGYDLPENHIHANSYLHFITRMRSLKKVEFDVPSSYFQERYQFTQQSRPTQVLPHVEEVTFRSTGCRSMQTLLNQLGFVLPNLKLLNLEKYCGEQREHAGEFSLDLQNYSAVKLTLDVEPVVVKLLKGTDFFVLEVDIQENCEERFYKVASDLSSVKLIKHSDLKGFYRSSDYLRVRVIVNCLEQIELHVQLEGEKRLDEKMGRQNYVIKLYDSE